MTHPTPDSRPAPNSCPTLYSWFAESARRHPDRVAVEFPDAACTYEQLHGLALRVAAAVLREHGDVPAAVGVPAVRGLAAYAGYLAALRLGAMVVPMNPAFPAQRNWAVAESAGLDVIITETPDAAAPARAASLVLDGQWARALPESSLPAPAEDPDAVAYAVFTSGSTGTPKGVAITNANVAPFLRHMIDRYELGPGCRTSHSFELTFDVSVFDLFATWASGATLVVPHARADLMNPVNYVTTRGLTHWYSVPAVVSLARRLRLLRPGCMPDLRHSLFAGDQFTLAQAEAWADAAPASTVNNLYGPTEVTVTCAEYRLPADRAAWPSTSNGTVPIGEVYPHLEHRITAEGELLLRGPQRFRGYLDPRDDVGRFEPPVDPGGADAARWYRTGDRVSVQNGRLVHLGRLDRQTKVRGGYRVELGEVEAVLRGHPSVEEVAVMAVTAAAGAEADLIAAYVGAPVAEADLFAYGERRLPSYMLPRRIHRVPQFPLNANGKTDWRRLADLVGLP